MSRSSNLRPNLNHVHSAGCKQRSCFRMNGLDILPADALDDDCADVDAELPPTVSSSDDQPRRVRIAALYLVLLCMRPCLALVSRVRLIDFASCLTLPRCASPHLAIRFLATPACPPLRSHIVTLSCALPWWACFYCRLSCIAWHTCHIAASWHVRAILCSSSCFALSQAVR